MSENHISQIFIFDNAGIPIFARSYEGNDINEVLIGGFFSAITSFSENEINSGRLLDIGFEKKRYHFHNHSKYSIIIVTNSFGDIIIDYEIKSNVNKILNNINLVIDICETVAAKLEIDSEDILEDIGNTIDSLIFEATLENTSIEMNGNLIEMRVGKKINLKTKITNN